jgi:hypothetical protein
LKLQDRSDTAATNWCRESPQVRSKTPALADTAPGSNSRRCDRGAERRLRKEYGVITAVRTLIAGSAVTP